MLNVGIVLSLALLLGRVAGLVRELILAAVFGVAPEADVAVLLLTLPDLLVNLLIAGGLSAALVPRLSGLRDAAAGALFRSSTLLVIGPFAAFGLVLALWPQGLFGLLAPGVTLPFGPGDACVVALAVALPLTSGAGVSGAYLNSRNLFFVTGCGTFFFNAGVIAALAAATGGTRQLELLAIGIVVGAALRWGTQLLVLPRSVWRVGDGFAKIDRPFIGAFAAATLASTLMLAAPLLIRAMASLLGTGAIASFNYAQKLVELPVGILITAISTVALARLSSIHVQQGDRARLEAAIKDARYSLLTAVAVTILGCQFANSLVQLLFGRGAMDAAAVARVALLAQVALLSVPFIALSSMAMANLNAAQQTRKILMPTLVSLSLLAVLAAPAMYLRSEVALMGAVVGFQAAVALLLSRSAGFTLFGRVGIFNGQVVSHMAAIVGVNIVAFAVDRLFALDNLYLRLAVASIAMICALAVVRLFLRVSSSQILRPVL